MLQTASREQFGLSPVSKLNSGDPVLSTFLLDTVLSTFGFDRFIHESYKIPFYPVFKNKLKLPFYPHFLVLKRFRDRFKCG